MVNITGESQMPIAEGGGRRRGAEFQIDPIAQLSERGVGSRDGQSGIGQEYMTTMEAAAYLRKSVSWVVKQADIPYLKGAPNTYRRRDLDSWFERHKENPRIA